MRTEFEHRPPGPLHLGFLFWMIFWLCFFLPLAWVLGTLLAIFLVMTVLRWRDARGHRRRLKP